MLNFVVEGQPLPHVEMWLRGRGDSGRDEPCRKVPARTPYIVTPIQSKPQIREELKLQSHSKIGILAQLIRFSCGRKVNIDEDHTTLNQSQVTSEYRVDNRYNLESDQNRKSPTKI